MLHLKLLEKQKQAQPKTSRRGEIIKIKAKINELEVKKKIQSMKQKAGSLKKKNDQPLANLTKMRREKTQISKIRNENGR
jgi:hypothetical protein